MSGGEKKKRATRSQGWEEAGSEFYQESYPGDGDMDLLWKDPKRLATLLPSKQTRAGLCLSVTGICFARQLGPFLIKCVFSWRNYSAEDSR